MEDWKKSEGTFNLACDPQRASGMMQNTCVKNRTRDQTFR